MVTRLYDWLSKGVPQRIPMDIDGNFAIGRHLFLEKIAEWSAQSATDAVQNFDANLYVIYDLMRMNNCSEIALLYPVAAIESAFEIQERFRIPTTKVTTGRGEINTVTPYAKKKAYHHTDTGTPLDLSYQPSGPDASRKRTGYPS